jgi:hypothetical protein
MTEDEIRYLFKAIQTESKWLGPKNYEEPLINPLRDPERARALYEADKAKIEQRLRKQSGETFLERLEKDERMNEVRDRILREQMLTEYRVQYDAYKQMALEVQHMADAEGLDEEAFKTRLEQDPQFKARIDNVTRLTKERIAAGMLQAKDKAYNEMYAEIVKWKKEQGIN